MITKSNRGRKRILEKSRPPQPESTLEESKCLPLDHQQFLERLQRIEDNRDRASLVNQVCQGSDAMTEANAALFAQAIFEEFNKPAEEQDEKRLVQYMSVALKARSVDLAYERFNFDAAKRAIKCAAQLQEINVGAGGEDEKIQKAITVLFGERPQNTTFQEEAA
jgi:hypothetical protein